MDHDAYDVGDNPVQGEPAGERRREEPEHQGHHPQHHAVGGLLPLVGRRHGGHLLHDEHGDAHQDGKHGCGVRDRQVQPQERAVQRNHMVHPGEPGVEVLGQAHHALGRRGHGQENGAVEPDPDGELDEHGPQATQRIYAMLLVEPHRFL